MSEHSRSAIEPDAVAKWFDTLGIEHRGPLQFTRIGLGQSNLTYLVCDADERRWVLRRPPVGHLLASAHDIEREARILSALEATDVPTPRVCGLTTDPAITDVPLLLMEYVDGVVVDTVPIAEALDPQRRRDIGLSLPHTLAKIHAVDLDEVGLVNLASHKPYAARQLTRWSRQWEQSKTRELPALESLTGRLRAAVPPQREVTLVHGDFHVRNVITSRVSGEIVAVLDWELATLGDPLADIGSLLAYWVQKDDRIGGTFTATALPGFPAREELAKTYLEETGRDPDALQFWFALGLWKVAIIAEGILRRAQDEPQNRAAAGTPSTERIDSLIAKAVEVADAAGI